MMFKKNDLKKYVRNFAFFLLFACFLMCDNLVYGAETEAKALDVIFEGLTDTESDLLTDGETTKSVQFKAGESLTVTAAEKIKGIYIKWSAVKTPGVWTLVAGESRIICGENGYLHEYVSVPGNSNTCTLEFSKTCGPVEITVYGEGELPRDVQVWNSPCERADFLVLSTHADDEILFLGGVLATYAGERGLSAQVVYLCDFTLDDYGYMNTTREHEKLDGLWEIGVRNYPVTGHFPDVYSTKLSTAKTQYDYDAVVEFVTENIRRFKPLILISQDFNGEYGHGAHKLFAAAAADALQLSNDPSYDTDSYEKYGVWDVKKAYYHLYTENRIRLDLRTPLARFNGLTSLEVQKNAYKKHVTQQGYWFYVSDTYEKFDCAAFGLYKTLVGADTGNDMTENIVTYEAEGDGALNKINEIGAKLFLRSLYDNLAEVRKEIEK